MQPAYAPQQGHVNHAPNVPVPQTPHHAALGIPQLPLGHIPFFPGLIDWAQARQAGHLAKHSFSSHEVTCALSKPTQKLEVALRARSIEVCCPPKQPGCPKIVTALPLNSHMHLLCKPIERTKRLFDMTATWVWRWP